MNNMILTIDQARRFILYSQGLLGDYKYICKQGVLDFIRQAGCIQFDPVDICGRNADLTLQSRVKDYQKNYLYELLYEDRKLFDYPDKQLSILPIENWAYFERFREAAREKLKSHPEIKEHIKAIIEYIKKNGAICSNDYKIEGDTDWWSAINWSTGGSITRSVLEQLYSSGDLVVHHKKGTRRYYDLAERYIPGEILRQQEPLMDDFEHLKWRVYRRIVAVGLLWNRPSDAFLGIWGLNNSVRNRVFKALLDDGVISRIRIEGISHEFYIPSVGNAFIRSALGTRNEIVFPEAERINAFPTDGEGTDKCIPPRCELIAPLDPLMWDRKLIKAIFNFDYKWEIYTLPSKRKYGAYVLPIIYGDSFIGRVEAVRDTKNKILLVKNIWYEDGVRKTKEMKNIIKECLGRFALFNGCGLVLKVCI